MAYSGWLLKIGDYTVPADKYIKASSYQVYVNMQDVDPWTDANGYLHREAVELKALKVEFETPAMLTNKEFSELMESVRSNYINATARTCLVTAYIPEYDDYITQTAYLADFQPRIYGTYGKVIHYDSIRFSFIGGVYSG